MRGCIRYSLRREQHPGRSSRERIAMSQNAKRSSAVEWSVPERRLAAIFAADIAGYSKAMHADESGAMRALQAMREVVDRLILARRGRIASMTRRTGR